MLNEPQGKDINVTTTPSSSLNEPVGQDIVTTSGVTGAKTAGGTSLEVVPESSFFDLLKAVAPDAETTLSFMTQPGLTMATIQY